MENQVFISYRRQDGFYPAYLLYKELIENGYSVFFDIKSIRRGEFPDIIKHNIENCVDYILIVTKTTFSNRIFDEGDWIRKEIKIALDNNKNIITVFIDAEIPQDLPSDIERIRNYNGIQQIDPNLIGENYRRLFNNFMISHPIVGKDTLVTRRCSIYAADYGDEPRRLEIQAQNAFETDKNILERIGIGGTVLDVGCAYGKVTKSRFDAIKYTQVIGIDKNGFCVTEAQKIGGKFDFVTMDIEEKDFADKFRSYIDEREIDGFDIIFISLVLHHLKDPYAVLRKLRKFLAKDGYIVVRGADDGSKLAYPDEHGYLKKIIDKTLQAPGVSDRLHGRKIFDWLNQSGYRNIHIYSFLRDTSNLSYDEREDLFKESFSYRVNYFRKMWEEDPTNDEKFSNFDEMETILALFENEFMKENFWYGEYEYVGVATK